MQLLFINSKRIILPIILIVSFLFAKSQDKLVPRFENDTLYTSCGFKIYKGQVLHFAKGPGRGGLFRYINAGNDEKELLTNKSFVVNSMSGFAISGLGNGYIYIHTSVTYADGSIGKIKFHMVFDKAIESFPGLPSELIVPDEFKKKGK